jgi:asparagine synthase (glutamine-hydrolysing)
LSGIVGILQLDGAPVDRPLFEGMTQYLTFRGPDALGTFVDGSVGLGHAMLRTTFEQAREQQPSSLDGQVWITADARIDGRPELRRELAVAGRETPADATDVELILHAYHAWGEGCVEHLLGDFAFALWDGRARKLFCGRDHFGVKPFYYAQAGAALVLSNTLNCVRLHPAVSSELNELAIADFLLFGYNQEVDTTIFADIRQLAPAHTLTVSDGALRARRFWTLPIEETLVYKEPDEYVAHFRELFDRAVGDRLRTDRLSLFMSGGLDSTSVAASAVNSQHSLPGGIDKFHFRAYTFVSSVVGPDAERDLAALAAKYLDIPIVVVALGGKQGFECWDDPVLLWSEPVAGPSGLQQVDALHQAALHGRVLLRGEGGDSGLYPSSGHFVDLARKWRFGQMAAEVWHYRRAVGRRPPLYFGTYFRKRFGSQETLVSLPSWLNRQFVDRLQLQARWEHVQTAPQTVHPSRPEAYSDLASCMWPNQFVRLDPGASRILLESRHPFFDVRLVSYLLRLPPVPWCVHKHLLRTAMRGALPEAIRTRPKAVLPHGEEAPSTWELLKTWARNTQKTPNIAAWVDMDEYRCSVDRLPRVDRSAALSLWRPASLARWLWLDSNRAWLPQTQP